MSSSLEETSSRITFEVPSLLEFSVCFTTVLNKKWRWKKTSQWCAKGEAGCYFLHSSTTCCVTCSSLFLLEPFRGVKAMRRHLLHFAFASQNGPESEGDGSLHSKLWSYAECSGAPTSRDSINQCEHAPRCTANALTWSFKIIFLAQSYAWP